MSSHAFVRSYKRCVFCGNAVTTADEYDSTNSLHQRPGHITADTLGHVVVLRQSQHSAAQVPNTQIYHPECAVKFGTMLIRVGQESLTSHEAARCVKEVEEHAV